MAYDQFGNWTDETQGTAAAAAAANSGQYSSGRGWLAGGGAPKVTLPNGAVDTTGQPITPGYGSIGANGFYPATPVGPSAQNQWSPTPAYGQPGFGQPPGYITPGTQPQLPQQQINYTDGRVPESYPGGPAGHYEGIDWDRHFVPDSGQQGMIVAPIDPNNFPGLRNTDTGELINATGKYAQPPSSYPVNPHEWDYNTQTGGPGAGALGGGQPFVIDDNRPPLYDKNGQPIPDTGGRGYIPKPMTLPQSGPQNGNYQAWVQALLGGGNNAKTTLTDHQAELEAAGFHVTPANAEGDRTKIQLPTGEWVRVIGNGEGKPVWNVQGNQSMNANLTRPFGSGIDTDKSNQLYEMLMNRAGQGLNINRNDPVIRAQTDAYGATQERSRRSYLQDLAESGGPNANISAERRASAEKVGQNTAGFEGVLMQHELDARRQEIESALSGAYGLLTAEQQMALQEELQQMSLAQNAYQYDTTQQYLNSPLAPGA